MTPAALEQVEPLDSTSKRLHRSRLMTPAALEQVEPLDS